MTSSLPAGSPPTPDTTPSLAEVLQYFAGSAQLMAGNPEGLRRLDLSADGFWTSFFAMIVSAPPLVLSWIEYEASERAGHPTDAGPVMIYASHALADALAWILPVLVLMVLAKSIGFRRKIVPLVVATNWGGALLAWLFAPYWLLLYATGPNPVMDGIGYAVGLGSIVLTIRLAASAIGRDLPAAIAVVALMIVTSLLAYGAVMDVTGVALI